MPLLFLRCLFHKTCHHITIQTINSNLEPAILLLSQYKESLPI